MNVVFDFGAVLFTWRPAALLAHSFPQRASTPQQGAHLAQTVFGHEDWHNFDRGLLSMATVIERTAARLDLDRGALTELVHGIGDRLLPIDDTVALLAQLHSLRQSAGRDGQGGDEALKLYYLSNMPAPYARTLEQKHSFLQWFDGGIFSGDVQHIKPEPAIYRLLQTRYALEPAQTLFIDDLPGNVEAARGLGWNGIHFESAPQLQAQLAHLLRS
ncbi:HAD family hydrolase [Rhodoferax ferrireducens]|uniref:HAD family hydrolase n=1 Tax=Rhodoferax ferrireducens TaxID=192843 RepID=UPI000E0D9A45|nr:HAD family phosphatase [Rhodoferax ferrireducens]